MTLCDPRLNSLKQLPYYADNFCAIQAPALSNSLPDNVSACSSPIIPELKSMIHCVTIMNHRVTINFELLKGTSNMMKYSTEWRTLFTGVDDVKFKGAHFA